MSNDNPNKGLFDLVKRIGGEITAFLAFVTAVVTFIRLLQGDTGLVIRILLALGLCFLWLSCIYIYLQFRKRRTAYSQRIQRIALAGIFAVPILTITGYAVWKYYPSNKIIVLVADFEGPDPKNYRVAQNIVEQLNSATKGYNDVQIQPLGEAIDYRKGSNCARTKGKEHKASIVLWGSYGKTTEMV